MTYVRVRRDSQIHVQTTWSVRESRTVQRLMVGNTDTTLSLSRWKMTKTLASAVHSAWEKKVLSTAKNSTSNLSKHLAKRHSNVKLADKPPATTSSDGPSPAKQVKIDERPTGGLALSNTELKELVAGYIVEDMLPISTVDSEPFRQPEGCTWRCRVCFHDCWHLDSE